MAQNKNFAQSQSTDRNKQNIIIQRSKTEEAVDGLVYPVINNESIRFSLFAPSVV